MQYKTTKFCHKISLVTNDMEMKDHECHLHTEITNAYNELKCLQIALNNFTNADA